MAVRIDLVTKNLGIAYSVVEAVPRKGEAVALRDYDDKTHHYRVSDVMYLFTLVGGDEDGAALHSEVSVWLEGA